MTIESLNQQYAEASIAYAEMGRELDKLERNRHDISHRMSKFAGALGLLEAQIKVAAEAGAKDATAHEPG